MRKQYIVISGDYTGHIFYGMKKGNKIILDNQSEIDSNKCKVIKQSPISDK